MHKETTAFKSNPRKSAISKRILIALAGKTNFEQVLESILVSLRDFISYDRAGLFLLDDQRRYLIAESAGLTTEQVSSSSLDENVIAKELKKSNHPIVVADIQSDPRFGSWLDMGPIRSWMGAPIRSKDKIVGFFSVGSLQIGFYRSKHSRILKAFVEILTPLLLQSWTEQSTNQESQNLEVISNIAYALGQAVDRETVLSTVIDQIPVLFQADISSFLVPDPTETTLTVISSTLNSAIGMQHSRTEDKLWHAFQNGTSEIVENTTSFYEYYPDPIYRGLFRNMVCGVIIPMQYLNHNYGILCLGFLNQRKFSFLDQSLFNTISGIAGNFIHQGVEFDELDEQFKQRSQHLSTLYKINSIANEIYELTTVLERILDITLDVVECASGYIQVFKENEISIESTVSLNISTELKTILDLEINNRNFIDQIHYRSQIYNSNNPEDMSRFSSELLAKTENQNQRLFCTPIRVKNDLLGILYILDGCGKSLSREVTTLLLTIASQLGSYIERRRLISRSEKTAVIEERQRFARELHDSISQLLYSQILFSGAGIKGLRSGNHSQVRLYLERIEKAAQQALKEMRLMIFELRPYEQLEGGFISGIQNRLNAVENRSDLKAYLNVIDKPPLNSEEQRVFYFIALEALNNILKHAQASSVKITIRQEDVWSIMEISDNGRGFNLESTSTSGGMGIKNMYHYAESVRATLNVFSKPDEGTQIILKLAK